MPTLPTAGRYQVYAKWTSDETRASDARYSIVHDGGTTAVTRNQRAGGGFWQYLGSYSFDPLLSPSVTLAANDNGSVAADAVRFVGGPAGATDVAYLHTDHLGTPQAMTDAGAQLLWWRDQTPFGQTVDTGGFSQTPIRFPGQFADDESGLHYNYFRDYDPALGRYIQSDPIGLRGGLNTYGYVEGNPLRYVDPTGEFAVAIPPAGKVVVDVATALLGMLLMNESAKDDDETSSQASSQGSSDSCKKGDKPDCDPPAGTQCYERNTGHKHKGLDPHYHVWQMNRDPSGHCRWNKRRKPKFTHASPPPGMRPCSDYPSWTNR